MLPRPARLASAGLAFLAPALVLVTTSAALAASETAALPGDPINGKAVYDANCVACHGASLQGGIGKRLSPIQKGHDNADFIIGTVTNGVKGTQMPAWGAANGGALDSRQISDVASYILSRQSAPATLDAGALARTILGGPQECSRVMAPHPSPEAAVIEQVTEREAWQLCPDPPS